MTPRPFCACPSELRPAFLPDTFHEINGVAHTSRQLEDFARRRKLPFLSVHCGPVTQTTADGPLTVVQVRRGPARIGLDANLDYDPFLMRFGGRIVDQIRDFGANLIHITGPGDMGIVGCYAAWRLQLPLVISWHTSFHEYAGRRLTQLLRFLGPRLSERLGKAAEKIALRLLVLFYSQARMVLAPNQELVETLRRMTSRPTFLMRRGIDCELFSPAKRNRATSAFRIGYAGRLTVEKNVRFLAELGKTLATLGRRDFEFVIIGQGREESWLRENVPNAILTGVLRGERLAEAYANMDLFVFPSTTDTFGNVILEALASGVPAVVTSQGGPKFLIDSGVTGYVANSDWDFISAVNNLMTSHALHGQMRRTARQCATAQSWDCVFEELFESYRTCLRPTSDWSPSVAPLLSSRVHVRGRP